MGQEREQESSRMAPHDEKDMTTYMKAKRRGDPTFTLVGQDKTSPRCIVFWIMENIETCPDAKLREALDDAIRMRNTNKRRWAD